MGEFNLRKDANVAQLAEQLICNQQVIGSSPIVGSTSFIGIMDGFPSGQRGQTVNLLATLSVVRIHLHPFCRSGGTGRRTGLKILRDLYSRTGSIPVCGSRNENKGYTKGGKVQENQGFPPFPYVRD